MRLMIEKWPRAVSIQRVVSCPLSENIPHPCSPPRLHVVCKVMQDSPYSLRWFKDLSWANLSCLKTACGHKPLKHKWHWRTEWMSKQILPGDRCCTRILHSRWWPTVFPHSQPPQHFSSNRFFFFLSSGSKESKILPVDVVCVKFSAAKKWKLIVGLLKRLLMSSPELWSENVFVTLF